MLLPVCRPYPSMHWAGGVCVYPSMHWAGGCVSQHALGRRCLPGGVSDRGVADTPRTRGRHPPGTRGRHPLGPEADTPQDQRQAPPCGQIDTCEKYKITRTH